MNFRDLGTQLFEEHIRRTWVDVPEEAVEILEQGYKAFIAVCGIGIRKPDNSQGPDGAEDGGGALGGGETGVSEGADLEQAELAERGQFAGAIGVAINGSDHAQYGGRVAACGVSGNAGPRLDGEDIQLFEMGHGEGLVADIRCAENGQGQLPQRAAVALQRGAQAGHDVVLDLAQVEEVDIEQVEDLQPNGVHRQRAKETNGVVALRIKHIHPIEAATQRAINPAMKRVTRADSPDVPREGGDPGGELAARVAEGEVRHAVAQNGGRGGGQHGRGLRGRQQLARQLRGHGARAVQRVLHGRVVERRPPRGLAPRVRVVRAQMAQDARQQRQRQRGQRGRACVRGHGGEVLWEGRAQGVREYRRG